MKIFGRGILVLASLTFGGEVGAGVGVLGGGFCFF